MDAKTLRIEIKAWEHAFKNSYNRDPTVEDIKNQPKIAEKYRLYKKLSRQLITTDYTADTNAPSTPPRPFEKHLRLSSALPPKKLAAASSDPPSEVNLFSPKKRALRKVVSENTNARLPSPPNPFTTPKKKKGDNNLASFDVQSHFSPTESFHQIQSIPYDPSIDKARKRLRGDPVTPSPKKKRRLIDIYENAGETVYDEDSSFVEESPVKKQAGNKDFTSLFQDVEAPAARRQRIETFAFPSKVEYAASIEDECSSLESKTNPTGGSKILSRSSKRESSRNYQSNECDDVSGDHVRATSLSNITEADPLGKYPILVPPSPPLESSMTAAQRAVMDRKRLKLESKSIEDVEDDQTDGEIEIKEWRRSMQHGESNEDELDSDLLTQQKSSSHYATSDRSEEAEGNVEIDLPEDLQKILVISPQTRRKDEKALINHLLYGRRNKSLIGKGAEIYDVGEVDGPDIESSDEDVWAGEGVPWEVAEM